MSAEVLERLTVDQLADRLRGGFVVRAGCPVIAEYHDRTVEGEAEPFGGGWDVFGPPAELGLMPSRGRITRWPEGNPEPTLVALTIVHRWTVDDVDPEEPSYRWRCTCGESGYGTTVGGCDVAAERHAT